jgi:hypothetical protein
MEWGGMVVCESENEVDIRKLQHFICLYFATFAFVVLILYFF